MSTKMHECEQTKQTIVVGVEVAIVEGFVLGIPQSIDKFLALVVAAQDRCCSEGADQTNAVAQFAESACWQYLVLLGQCAVGAILVDKLIDTLSIEEVLDGLAILALPVAIDTMTPHVVKGDVHRYAP